MLDQRLATQAAPGLAGFLCEVGPEALRLEVESRPGWSYPDRAVLECYAQEDELRLRTPGLFEAHVQLDARRGRLVIAERDLRDERPKPFALHAALKALWPLLLLREDALLLHASAVARGDAGAVFIGPSGAGKSTLAAMFEPSWVLNDELVVLRLGGEPRLASTPFFGTTRAPRAQRSARARAAFFLEHGSSLEMRAVPGSIALPPLLKCVALPSAAPDLEARALELAARALDSVEFRLLRFPLDAASVVRAVSGLL